MEEVRSQLFDSTSRLARCTALLQRMVEENAELKQELAELHGYKAKCIALEQSLAELQRSSGICDEGTSAPPAQALCLAPAPTLHPSESESSSSKRPYECHDGGSSLAAPPGSKRSRPSPQKGEHEGDSSPGSPRGNVGATEEAGEVPWEMRVAVLRTRALEREEEVKRLRSLMQAREGEFAQERKQLVGKLMASEQVSVLMFSCCWCWCWCWCCPVCNAVVL